MTDKQTTMKEAFENIESVRESIRGMHGEKYLLVVQSMAAALKRAEVTSQVLFPLFTAMGAPEILVKVFSSIMADLDATQVTNVAKAAEIDVLAIQSKEMGDWARRLVEAEHSSLLSVLPPELRAFLEGKGKP